MFIQHVRRYVHNIELRYTVFSIMQLCFRQDAFRQNIYRRYLRCFHTGAAVAMVYELDFRSVRCTSNGENENN